MKKALCFIALVVCMFIGCTGGGGSNYSLVGIWKTYYGDGRYEFFTFYVDKTGEFLQIEPSPEASDWEYVFTWEIIGRNLCIRSNCGNWDWCNSFELSENVFVFGARYERVESLPSNEEVE
jgi:hypothetical protein